MTDFESLHPRATSGQFTDKTQSAPQVSLSVTPPATAIGPRIIAMVQLQFWRNDYAIDADNPIRFDATDIVNALSPEDRAALEDHTYQSDEIYFAAVRAGLVKDHDGPFYVEVSESKSDYDEALENPVIGEFLFGSREELNEKQLATIAVSNSLFPDLKPNISVHDLHAIDIIYSRMTDDGDIETVRFFMNEDGEVTDGGFGEFWEDDDTDHPQIEAMMAARGRTS